MWFPLLCILVASTQVSEAFQNCDCLDICLIIDTSRSINDMEWIEMEDFLCGFVETFIVANFDVQFAAVNFSKSASLLFNLGQIPSLTAVQGELKNIERQRKTTRHNLGLQIALDDVFTNDGGDRDDATCPDIVVMISDGYNFTGGDTLAVAHLLRESNVTIASVAIGNNQVIQLLDDIASINPRTGEKLLVTAMAFDQLGEEVQNLFNILCPNDCETTTTPKPSVHGYPEKQTCCCGFLFGDIYNRKPDNEFNCCDKECYNPEYATCCGGIIDESLAEASSRCCGGVAFDPEVALCCTNTVAYTKNGETACCFQTAYDPYSQVCCGLGEDAIVYDLYAGSQCCGNLYIDTDYNTCCGEVVHPGNQCETRCCNTVVYDSFSQNCCDLDSSLVIDGIRDLAGSLTILYCGGKTYDPAWQTCCCGVIFNEPVTSDTACCLTVPYDLYEHICCNGVLQEGDPGTFECCGTERFNPSTQTCCWGVVFNGLGDCCGTAGILDPQSQICCNDQVYPHILDVGYPPAYSCCTMPDGNVEAFNVYDQVCCDGHVAPGGDFFRCCGTTSYETLWQNCCHGEVVSRSTFKNTGWCD